MKTLKKISILLAVSCGTAFLSGCADYLNVSDELAAEMTMEEVFENTSYIRRFHSYIYTGIPNTSNIICVGGNGNKTGLDNPWPSLTDELKCAQFNTKDIAVNGYHAGNAAFTRWTLYKQIRQANQFLEYAHATPENDALDYISETELAAMKNEARFLRAYYHFLLFELYGAVPIMNSIVSSSSTDLDFYRNSIDEVVSFIDKEMNACFDELPDKELTKERAAVPTKVAALAVLAKLHIYAASPLYNGGYSEAVNLRDNKDKQLFPAKDDKKWDIALNALQRLIDYCKNKYWLFKANNSSGQFDASESIYQLFQECEKNSEVLWFTSQNAWGTMTADARERRCTPLAISNGMGCVGVLQEVIDDYFMSDGKSIHESELYDKENEVAPDGTPYMYLNREPRFYQSITYASKPWHVIGTKIYYHKGSKDSNATANMTYSGYGLYKGMNRNIYNVGSNPKGQYRAGIIFRLADFYLLYAEALNHVNPSDRRIVDYVDSVRVRAGIPLLKDIKPEIIGNQALQENAIRKERRVELFAEGQRYFDVRRWMCAEEEGYKQGGPVHGMDMNGNNLQEFMAKRVTFETRIFEKRMYLYPIPLAEIQKSRKLVQNPGW